MPPPVGFGSCFLFAYLFPIIGTGLRGIDTWDYDGLEQVVQGCISLQEPAAHIRLQAATIVEGHIKHGVDRTSMVLFSQLLPYDLTPLQQQ